MYYELVGSPEELVGSEGFLRLPSYIFDEYVFDDNRTEALKLAVNYLLSGQNILIVGKAGAGKTAFLAILLRELISRGYRVAKIINGETVRRNHESQGIILFFDDLPRIEKRTLLSIVENNAKMIIATARLEEIDELNYKLGERPETYFKYIYIGEMTEEKLREILYRFARREGIDVEPQAADIVVSKADKLPVYVWQVIRDLVISRISKLDAEFARRIPQGMLDYVDRILWNVIGDSDDRLEVLLTLMIMTLMPEYEMHQDIFNAVFLEATREVKNIDVPPKVILLKSETLDRVRRYLVKTPRYSFRLPHDSWADVLRGKSTGLLSSEISKLLFAFPPNKQKEILERAIKRAYEEAISESKDPARVREFFRQINLLGLGKIILEVSEKAKKIEATNKIIPKIEKIEVPTRPKQEIVEVARSEESVPKQEASFTQEIAVEKREVSRTLYAVSKKVFVKKTSGYGRLIKMTEISDIILRSPIYLRECGITKSEALSNIMYRKMGSKWSLKYPCWSNLHIVEKVSVLGGASDEDKIVRFLVALFVAALLGVIFPLLALIVLGYAFFQLFEEGKLYLIELTISGEESSVSELIRDIRMRLGRNPVRISPKAENLIVRKLGLDPFALERAWYSS